MSITLQCACELCQRASFLPRDAMHKRGLCRHAVSVCLCVSVSVCPSRSWIISKRIDISSNFFTIGSIVVFPYETARQYSGGNPLTGASNAGGVGRNRDFELDSACTVNRSGGKCNTLSCDGPWRFYNTSRW